MDSIHLLELSLVLGLGGTAHSCLTLKLNLVISEEVGHLKCCDNILMHECSLSTPVAELIDLLKDVADENELMNFCVGVAVVDAPIICDLPLQHDHDYRHDRARPE